MTFGDRQLPIAPDLDDSRLEARFGPLPRTSLAEGVAATYRRFAELQALGKLDLSDLGIELETQEMTWPLLRWSGSS